MHPTRVSGDVNRKDNIYRALLEFQKNAPSLAKSSTNPHFGNAFVPLEQIIERVLPALHAQGILVLQPTDGIGEKSALVTCLYHVPTDTFLESKMPLELDKVTPQGQGSAITYARRYALLSMLGLVGDEDNDAEVRPTLRGNRARAVETRDTFEVSTEPSL